MHALHTTVLAGLTAAAIGLTGAAHAAGETEPLPEVDWSFSGVFGTYDTAQLQRGFLVYSEVCASCHSLDLVAYRNLGAIGLGDDQIKAIAAQREVPGEPDEEGQPTTRPALPSDQFVAPYANEQEARALNGGALPPDLSLIVKARPGGADYVHAILTGYEEPPPGFELNEGSSYNKYFTGKQIAMPPPLGDDYVEYPDGTAATLDQLSKDVTAFLTWAAKPEMEARKRMGVKVILFLIVLTALIYAIKRKIWSDLH